MLDAVSLESKVEPTLGHSSTSALPLAGSHGGHHAYLCGVLVPMIAGGGVPSLVQAAGPLVHHRASIHVPIPQQRLLSVWQAVLAVIDFRCPTWHMTCY